MHTFMRWISRLDRAGVRPASDAVRNGSPQRGALEVHMSMKSRALGLLLGLGLAALCVTGATAAAIGVATWVVAASEVSVADLPGDSAAADREDLVADHREDLEALAGVAPAASGALAEAHRVVLAVLAADHPAAAVPVEAGKMIL